MATCNAAGIGEQQRGKYRAGTMQNGVCVADVPKTPYTPAAPKQAGMGLPPVGLILAVGAGVALILFLRRKKKGKKR